jgi:nitroreductase
MLLALQAQGFSSIWRTGDPAYDPEVKRAFGLRESDAIVGFLYVGTPKQPPPAIVRPEPSSFVSEWLGPEG